jgi:hypothetical protein
VTLRRDARLHDTAVPDFRRHRARTRTQQFIAGMAARPPAPAAPAKNGRTVEHRIATAGRHVEPARGDRIAAA